MTSLLDGLVVASYGKRFGVEIKSDDGESRVISCVTRGKKTDLACGDQVQVRMTSPNEAVVEKLKPRQSLLYRSNSMRSKMLAANVTQVIIVLATTPSFYEELLNRCLLAAETANIRAVIVLNKCDLAMPRLCWPDWNPTPRWVTPYKRYQHTRTSHHCGNGSRVRSASW